jgi:hypothetical protein
MKYYVYEHWRTDTDLCFYVGKGCGKRAYDMQKRYPRHKAIQKELEASGHAIEIRIVSSGLEEPDAYLIEAQRIVFWWKAGVPIINVEKRLPYKPETIARMRQAAHRRGGFPAAAREAQKKACTGRKRKPFTAETIRRMKLAALAREARKRALAE